jgi:hypothetical protein
MDNLDKRGKDLVEGTTQKLKETAEDYADIAYYSTHSSEPGAGEKVKAAVERRAEAPAKEAVGMVKGFRQMVKRVGEAGGDIAYYSTHSNEPGASAKIASGVTDIVLDAPQIVLTVEGAAGLAKGAAGAFKGSAGGRRQKSCQRGKAGNDVALMNDACREERNAEEGEQRRLQLKPADHVAIETGTVLGGEGKSGVKITAGFLDGGLEGTARTAVFGPETAQQSFKLTHPSVWNQFLDFFATGVEHIWRGYDHILFLLSLLLPAVLVRSAKGWESCKKFRAGSSMC